MSHPALGAKLLAALFGILTIVMFGMGRAQAHPHVWIYAYSDAVFDEAGRVTAVNVEWEFDEFYSVVAVEGLDTNGNGRYESAELQPLAAANIAALKDWGYFVEVSAGDELLTYGEVTEFGSYIRDNVLVLHFVLPLAEPVDPLASTVSYKMYDPSFYISIEYASRSAITAIGNMPEACGIRLVGAAGDQEDLPVDESYFQSALEAGRIGAIYAETVLLNCEGEPAS